jgi:repressor LexA
MAKELTKRQRSILEYIIEFIRDNGYPPTLVEIGGHFDIASTNGVNDHLLALERKGYITRTSKARSIHVTEKAAADLYKNDAGALPLVGRVAAGQPILAQENVENHIVVDARRATPGSYCLRVHGDSMIEDGIMEGDILVVDASRPPRPGDVVVALVEDEATVKHFHPRGDAVELRPANAAMDSIVVPAQSLRIQGVVVSLQRDLH